MDSFNFICIAGLHIHKFNLVLYVGPDIQLLQRLAKTSFPRDGFNQSENLDENIDDVNLDEDEIFHRVDPNVPPKVTYFTFVNTQSKLTGVQTN